MYPFRSKFTRNGTQAMRLTEFLGNLSRPKKQAVMVANDIVTLSVAVWLAFALRLGKPLPTELVELWWLMVVVPLLSLPCLAATGLYRSVVRHIGPQALWAVVKGVTLSAICFAALVTLARLDGVPRTSYWLFWMVGLFAVGGPRLLARSWLRGAMQKLRVRRQPVAVYGAGNAGIQLAGALSSGREYEPRLFIDDNPSLAGTVVDGLRVYRPQDLPRLIEKYRLSDVLLALPSLSRSRRRRVVERLEGLPVQVKTVPTFSDIVAGHAQIDDIREVGIDDLLGRDPVKPSETLLDRCIRGKNVMVTGAGGSIGAELCRQILQREPHTLILFEISELSLYEIERELQALAEAGELGTRIVALLGNVQQQPRLEAVMRQFSVQTVYHAAAYKHVPMVEQNLLEGLQNNVFGTVSAAQAAMKTGVRWFVLVSTDKAVRPTNVMGASKRFAELILQALSTGPANTRTVFSMVRFGNVLGSSGSVVPVFREQIRHGGPVTVTHRDMTRYFMTIPEAASLVIQAGAMAEGGDVFVLDMGESVKVLDLARRMIRLSGLQVKDKDHPDGDIEIRFSGIRPGEKLFEELLIGDNVATTDHPMIMRAEEKCLDLGRLTQLLDQLHTACDSFDCERAHALLDEAVDGFDASRGVADAVWAESRLPTTNDVIPFPPERRPGG